MLPTQYKLKKKKDFDAVFKKGKGVKRGFLLIRTLKSQLPASRFGFVISKKISTKATVRNKIKRRLSHAVFNHINLLGRPHDVVIIALPEIKNKEFKEINNAVSQALKNI